MTRQTNSSVATRLKRPFVQAWRDLLSIYYANTPTWRWLKSGALLFLGFFLWTTGAVVLSVQPDWTVMHYVMAYGFLLIVWGPFTHFVVVPFTIRLRRTASHPVARSFSRNSGKINLAIFFSLVIILGAIAPSFMMLEFVSPSGTDGETVSGSLDCDVGEEVVTCEIRNPGGFDHLTVSVGDEEILRVDEPPWEFEVDKNEVDTRFAVDLRDEDGERVRRFIQRV